MLGDKWYESEICIIVAETQREESVVYFEDQINKQVGEKGTRDFFLVLILQ